MNAKIDWDPDELRRPLRRGGEPRVIAEVLAELLCHCQSRRTLHHVDPFPQTERDDRH